METQHSKGGRWADERQAVIGYKFLSHLEVFVARITRKELKSDKFAQDVGLTVTFFEEHQKDVVRYGAIAAAVVLRIVAYRLSQRHQRGAGGEARPRAIQIQESPGAKAGDPHSFP